MDFVLDFVLELFLEQCAGTPKYITTENHSVAGVSGKIIF